MTIFEGFIDGDPAPKGSVSVNRGRRGVRHTQRSKDWHAVLVDAIRRAQRGYPMVMAACSDDEVAPYAGEVAVHAELRLRQPRSNDDASPTALRCGDIDKHARTLLDAIVGARLIEDDSLVVELNVTKRWAGPTERCGVQLQVREPTATIMAKVFGSLGSIAGETFVTMPPAEPVEPMAPGDLQRMYERVMDAHWESQIPERVEYRGLSPLAEFITRTADAAYERKLAEGVDAIVGGEIQPGQITGLLPAAAVDEAECSASNPCVRHRDEESSVWPPREWLGRWTPPHSGEVPENAKPKRFVPPRRSADLTRIDLSAGNELSAEDG